MREPAPTVSARFKLLRRLGEGAMGTVYEAQDTERNERVALKVLKNANPESLVRFKREFRTLQDIHHRNLVTLGELVSEGSTWFFTMELVNGEDFVSWVTTPPSRPPARTGEGSAKTNGQTNGSHRPAAPFVYDEVRLRDGLVQLVSGLHALHEMQRVHRDVKPSNVLVDRSGRVVILDFGLVADLTGDQGATMTDLDVVGTPAYMAPEQAASRAVGPAADWYAVGVLLYEALTGELPFSGAPLEVLLRKQKDEPPAASSIARDIPPDLDELCTRLLRFDPAARPSGAKILARLQAAPGPGPRKTMPSLTSMSLGVPFVGREHELEELRRAYEDTRAGKAVTVLVHGESGIGKSCLVRHFTDVNTTADRDLLVLHGRCYEREAVPYKAFDGVVDALARFLGRLPSGEADHFVPTRPAALVQVFPVLRRVEAIAHARAPDETIADPHELRARAFGAMRELLVRLADRRPLILVIDDMQWADADSYALLDELLRPPGEPPLLLIATLRDQSIDATTQLSPARLRNLELPGDVRRIDLERLGKDDARSLVTRLVERLAPGMAIDAATLAREADGHPLFIDEIVRHMFLVGGSQGTLRLEDALWSRVASLEEGPRRIVEVVAVAGSPLPQDTVAKAADATPAEFARLVSFLRVAHLVVTTGSRGIDSIECFHSRVRDAVLANLDDDARKKHHWRLAVALESTTDADPDSLAIHWLGAGDVNNAAKHMLAAADRAAAALAFERAARLYERALQLRERATRKMLRPEERALQAKLGDALSHAGRGAQAARAYRAAAAGANAAEGLDLQRRAADQLLRSGHFDEGLTAIQDVLASVGMTLPTAPWRALLALLMWRAVLAIRGFRYKLVDASHLSARELTRIDVCYAVASSLSLVDPIRGQLFQQRNILLSLRLGEPQRVARALATEVSYRGMSGSSGWKRTSTIAAEARRVAESVGDPQSLAWSTATSAVAQYLSGQFEPALAGCEAAEKIFVEECKGAVWETFTMRLFALQCLAHLGRLRDIRTRHPLALRGAMERGDLYAATNLRIGYPNLAWLIAGDTAGARREATEAMRQWSTHGFHLEHYYELLALTNADLYDGSARVAYDRLVARWAPMRRSLITRVQMVRLYAWNMRGRAAVAVAARDPAARDECLAVATRDARAVLREQAPWSRPSALVLQAAVARIRGDDHGAIALLEDAVRGADAEKVSLVAAAARHALGTCRGGEEGKRLMAAAHDTVTRDGAKDAARLLAMMAPGFERG